MDGIKGAFDSFRVEEAYNWRDDIMEITCLIVHETDEARLNNIAEHFEVDLSEIREFLEAKQKRMGKPMTNAERIRSMTDEELAEFLDRWEMGDVDYSKTFCDLCDGQYDCHDDCLMDWLKAPVEVDNGN